MSLRVFRAACVSLLFLVGSLIVNHTTAQAGTLDPTFDGDGRATTHGGQYNNATHIFALPDGKIVVAGETAQAGFHLYAPSPTAARYNSDGSPDTSFGSNGVIPGVLGNMVISDVLLQPDGKLVFIGYTISSWNSPPIDFAVVRYNSNGTLDTTFGSNGLVVTSIGGSYDAGVAGVLLPDGKLLVAGYTYGTQTSPGAIDFVRYNSNGTLDTTFDDDGILYYLVGGFGSVPRITDMIALTDGKFLVKQQGSLVRFNADLSVDMSFGSNGFAPVAGFSAEKLTLQPDGKIIVAGSHGRRPGSGDTFTIWRLKSDGSPDEGFGTGGMVTTTFRRYSVGYTDALVGSVVLKSNGEIIAVGGASDVYASNTNAFAVARYASNGTLLAQTTFTFSPSAMGQGAAIQPDGKILVSGLVTVGIGNDLAVARLTNITNDIRPFKRLYNFYGTTADNIIVYRPDAGGGASAWYNYTDQSYSPQFGSAGDIIAPADYNGDGIADLAVFRPANGTWYIANNYFIPDNLIAVQWGAAGDVPVAADYDGDGKADVAVFRPSNGTWYVLNSQDNSARFVPFGTNGDKPVIGDYDADGKADIAVFRPSNGTWYVLRSTDNQFTAVQFGASGDIPVQGDYNGDGVTEMVVFRPGNGTWYTSTNPAINYGATPFGASGDIPVPGDYDADGKTDIAVWRPTNRTWYVRRSTNGTVYGVQWGAAGDVPVPGN